MELSNFIVKTILNSNQLKAVEATEGPLLVIAGPGSGKTKTLVERIVYLSLKGVKSENIMVATFTEKEARELITRVSNRLLELDLKVNLNEMYIGTLHSIFLRILEENREYTRLKRNYRLLDQFDQRYFVFRNIKAYKNIENSELLFKSHKISDWKKADIVISYIGKVSEKSFHLDHYCFDSHPEQKMFRTLLADDKVEKVWFTGMLTHGQTDFVIPYIDHESHTLRSYYPDFLVQLTDGSYIILEVKGDNMIDDSVVKSKQEYASQLAIASQMKYQIIKGSDAMKGITIN
ncbi:MAG: UvrD-helicase domain-containing protein [Bacteroidota bacterium]|nr:UvrD-helicase domain-containing protein [Bacteroidota bacterium]